MGYPVLDRGRTEREYEFRRRPDLAIPEESRNRILAVISVSPARIEVQLGERNGIARQTSKPARYGLVQLVVGCSVTIIGVQHQDVCRT